MAGALPVKYLGFMKHGPKTYLLAGPRFNAKLLMRSLVSVEAVPLKDRHLGHAAAVDHRYALIAVLGNQHVVTLSRWFELEALVRPAVTPEIDDERAIVLDSVNDVQALVGWPLHTQGIRAIGSQPKSKECAT